MPGRISRLSVILCPGYCIFSYGLGTYFGFGIFRRFKPCSTSTLYKQDDEPVVLISPSYIEEQLKFRLRMFIRVMSEPLRKINKRKVGLVISFQLSVDERSAGLVLYGSLFNAVRLSVLDYSFFETDILCYLIHADNNLLIVFRSG